LWNACLHHDVVGATEERAMADHPTGNPDLIRQHKAVQHQGDQELHGADAKGRDVEARDETLARANVAGVSKPSSELAKRPPQIKPATEPSAETEAGGDAGAGGSANAGP